MRKTFIQCGILGWGMEILWTGLDSFRRRDFKLTGSFFPLDVPHLRLRGLHRPRLQTPPEEKSPFPGKSLYARHLPRGIFHRLPLKEEKLVPLGLWRCSLKHPRRHPTGLCAFMAARRALFRTCTELHEKRGQSPSFRIRNLTASHTPEPVIK